MPGLLRARSTLILLGLAALVAWLLAAKLMTPTSLTILTGPEDSGTHADALRYKLLLEQRGVRTTVEPTDGSVENLRRLVREGGNQIAFAEVGLEKAVDEPELDGAAGRQAAAPLAVEICSTPLTLAVELPGVSFTMRHPGRS